MKSNYFIEAEEIIISHDKEISIFNIQGENIDKRVVEEFGEEWLKFSDFNDENIKTAAEEYFDIVDDTILNKQTYVLDVGCGTGRWTRYLSSRAGFIEAVDPSNAIFTAAKLLKDIKNVRLARASVETLPFEDETFDFVMSIGVLHHIPDTAKAMRDCVKKVKKGGYFYVYLYYNLEKRGPVFKGLFKLTDFIRSGISRLPGSLKKIVCDILAVIFYMPLVLTVKLLYFLGFSKLAKKMPLSTYHDKSFFLIRNDALDRFGTRLEQRFSAKEVYDMMGNAGLTNIRLSPGVPYYHAVGQRT